MAKAKTRPYAVDIHPQCKEIQRELAQGVQIKHLSDKYGLSRQALVAYKRNKLPQAIIKSVERRDITDAKQLFGIILKVVQYMETMADSAAEYLRDPDDFNKFYMGARAEEIEVVWEKKEGEYESGRPIYRKMKSSLQDLLDIAVNGDDMVTKLKSAHTDPRVLLIKSSDTLSKQMELMISCWKAIDQGSTSFIGTPAWDIVLKNILEATEDYPEVRRAIAERLSNINL